MPVVELRKGHMNLLISPPPNPPLHFRCCPPIFLSILFLSCFTHILFVTAICSFFALSYLILRFLSPHRLLSASNGMSASSVSDVFSSLLFAISGGGGQPEGSTHLNTYTHSNLHFNWSRLLWTFCLGSGGTVACTTHMHAHKQYYF